MTSWKFFGRVAFPAVCVAATGAAVFSCGGDDGVVWAPEGGAPDASKNAPSEAAADQEAPPADGAASDGGAPVDANLPGADLVDAGAVPDAGSDAATPVSDAGDASADGG
jgi:hypothetical protein